MGDTATIAPDIISLSGLDAGIWPCSACLESDGEISVGGLRLSTLAARYGTPAYIVDEADVRYRCRAYSDAFPGAEIAYAGQAFLCRAMARWIAQEGLSLGVCSAGELAVARSVSFPADRIVLHGIAKTPADLQAAVGYGAGRIVIDSASEIIRLAALAYPLARPRQRVLIRVTPGVDAHAHRAVATGVQDQRFGFSLSSGAAADAVRRVLTHPELELVGLHGHLGSPITRPPAAELAARKPPCPPAAAPDREAAHVVAPTQSRAGACCATASSCSRTPANCCPTAGSSCPHRAALDLDLVAFCGPADSSPG
jgi:diaminopimelate decarboxylase